MGVSLNDVLLGPSIQGKFEKLTFLHAKMYFQRILSKCIDTFELHNTRIKNGFYRHSCKDQLTKILRLKAVTYGVVAASCLDTACL